MFKKKKNKVEKPVVETVSTVEDNSINKYEKDRISCELLVYGDKERVLDFVEACRIESGIPSKRVFSFYGIVDNFDASEPGAFVKNWGCRFDASHPTKWGYEAETETMGEANIEFYTFHLVPQKWYQQAVAAFPDLVITLIWLNHYDSEAGQLKTVDGITTNTVLEYDKVYE